MPTPPPTTHGDAGPDAGLDPGTVGIALLATTARVTRWAGRRSTTTIRYAQLRVLSQLDDLGPSRISALAIVDRCAQPTMSVLVQRLEEHGWVDRSADPEDTRASLVRLNDQLKKNNRRPAVILFDERAKTDEDLLDSVNAGRIRATIVDDYIYDLWKKDMLKIADTNRDVSVSQDGVIAWVSRKDAPALTTLLKDFFSTRKLTF